MVTDTTSARWRPPPSPQPTQLGLIEHLASAPSPAENLPDLRVALHEGSVGSAILLSVSAPNAPPSGRATRAQIALPIAGLFAWEVGRKRELIDANTALFIESGQEFAETHPLKGAGHASALVEPTPGALDEIQRSRPFGAVSPFNRVALPASARSQLIAHRLLGLSPSQLQSAGDELIITFLLELFGCEGHANVRQPKPIVARAKAYIHGLGGERLALEKAAQEIGVTPIYLTQAFKACEGIPLYRYHLNVRLSQALCRLGFASSITDLALELGFSSHSHFSAAFVARYGLSPSDYRDEARARTYFVRHPPAPHAIRDPRAPAA